MKKVITFSLWGSNPMYNIGSIKNAELAKIFYPDFECWFYIHNETVPYETIENLSKLDNTKIIFKNGDLLTNKPMMWRFEAIDDPEVEVMISRDTDSRFTLREKLAVEEWLNSDKLFHIMRDHPHHEYEIQAGMFGTKKISSIQSWSNLINIKDFNGEKTCDQDFLRHYIYHIVKDNSIIHASFNKYENELCKDFPIPYCEEYKFVGEYIYADESRSQFHIDILKNSICL